MKNNGSRKNLSISFVIIGALVSIVGCSTARVVNVQPRKGGVIAVNPAQSPEARKKAENLMSMNCGGAWDIVEEGEAVIGQESHSSNNSQLLKTSLFSTGTTQTRNQTEWRLTYKCK